MHQAPGKNNRKPFKKSSRSVPLQPAQAGFGRRCEGGINKNNSTGSGAVIRQMVRNEDCQAGAQHGEGFQVYWLARLLQRIPIVQPEAFCGGEVPGVHAVFPCIGIAFGCTHAAFLLKQEHGQD
jgi:hypothetical protein